MKTWAHFIFILTLAVGVMGFSQRLEAEGTNSPEPAGSSSVNNGGMSDSSVQSSSSPSSGVAGADYSLGANILRGEVVAVEGDQLTLKDATSGQTKEIKVSDAILLSNINKGDRVRVNFSTDNQTAANIIKEGQ